jgi:hypothetical protein
MTYNLRWNVNVDMSRMWCRRGVEGPMRRRVKK